MKLKFWDISWGCWHWFLVYLWKQYSLCFVWPIAKTCPTHKADFRTWGDKVTFTRSFKEKPRYRNSKKTELFYLSGLLALPQGSLVNTMAVLFWCCRCTNSVFIAIYVNNLVARMSFWQKSNKINPNFFWPSRKSTDSLTFLWSVVLGQLEDIAKPLKYTFSSASQTGLYSHGATFEISWLDTMHSFIKYLQYY